MTIIKTDLLGILEFVKYNGTLNFMVISVHPSQTSRRNTFLFSYFYILVLRTICIDPNGPEMEY